MIEKGKLWIIVGPSGSGKDSLISGAKLLFVGDPQFVFPQREITRSSDAGGEKHIEITKTQFDAKRKLGKYALSWSANGFDYGVNKSIDGALIQGKNVVLNGSRGVLAQIQAAYPNSQVIYIQVPTEILRLRLKKRGRENEDEIEKRIQRSLRLVMNDGKFIYFKNDRPLKESVKSFTAILKG